MLNSRKQCSQFSSQLSVRENTANFFKHRPLRDAATQIRLVRFYFANANPQNTEISGELRHFDVANAPEYKALSYAWGESGLRHTILLNGKKFRIRRALHDFLRICARWLVPSAFRILFSRKESPLWIWIDQLSIDQHNAAERGQQVLIMGDIFARAEEVLVWVGQTPSGAKLPRYINSYKLLLSDPKLHLKRQPRPRDWQMKAFRAFCSSGYWSRLWIVQEIMLGISVKFLWADQEILRDCIDSFMAGMNKGQRDSLFGDPVLRDNFFRILPFSATGKPYSPKKTPFASLGKALDTFCTGLCSEPRDHIYGLYALFPLTIRERLPVDYSLDAVTLLIRVLLLVAEETADEAARERLNGRQIASLTEKLVKSMFPEKFAIEEEREEIEYAIFSPLLDESRRESPIEYQAWKSAFEEMDMLLRSR